MQIAALPTDKEASNFSWLAVCPHCGALDHHSFKVFAKNVVERTCTNRKCLFKWLQH